MTLYVICSIESRSMGRSDDCVVAVEPVSDGCSNVVGTDSVFSLAEGRGGKF